MMQLSLHWGVPLQKRLKQASELTAMSLSYLRKVVNPDCKQAWGSKDWLQQSQATFFFLRTICPGANVDKSASVWSKQERQCNCLDH